MTMALLSPEGRELLDRLAGERVDPGRALELARALRGRYPPDLVAAALTQQELRVAAATRSGGYRPRSARASSSARSGSTRSPASRSSSSRPSGDSRTIVTPVPPPDRPRGYA